MNINNKINKIDKLIINNKNLLDVKYEERNKLLENISENKVVKDDLNKVDEYIENIEVENKKLEKELQDLNIYNTDINLEKEKTQLCKYYNSPKGCDKGKKCSFAHNELELKKNIKSCFSGLKCYKKDCGYSHPKDWDYKINMKICEFFKNGYCINEDNCKFKHVKENEIEKINNYDNIEVKENIDISNKEEFPSLEENMISNITNINKDILEDSIKNEDLQDGIQYSEINKNEENNSSPNIEIFVNGIEYDDKDINKKNNLNESKQKEVDKTENIETLINNLQYNFLELSRKIKNNIDETFIEDKYIYSINMKLELNKIISAIELFKNNYQDIMNENIINDQMQQVLW